MADGQAEGTYTAMSRAWHHKMSARRRKEIEDVMFLSVENLHIDSVVGYEVEVELARKVAW